MALHMALPMVLPPTPKRKREVDEREMHPATKFLISNDKKQILATNTHRVYTCATCNMEFSSFQALGGHRAGHKNRSKIDADVAMGSVPIKSHTCSYCSEKFVSGQALGGHMRKHRAAMQEKSKPAYLPKRKILDSGNYKEDEIIVLRTDPVSQLGCYCGSTPVTIDFFPGEPVRAEKVPAKIVPVLVEDDPWLELTLGPSVVIVRNLS